MTVLAVWVVVAALVMTVARQKLTPPLSDILKSVGFCVTRPALLSEHASFLPLVLLDDKSPSQKQETL